MQENFGATLMGSGFLSFSGSGLMVVTGMLDSTFWGDDTDTTLVCVGRGDITAVLGNGWNFAKGGSGNDTFIGGNNYNRLMGGGGDDLLVGGTGDNELAGGWGDDTLVFGQWDTALGGPGIDVFVYMSKSDEGGMIFETPPLPPTVSPPVGDTVTIPESFSFIDWNTEEGDVLDLTMSQIERSMLKKDADGDLVAYTPTETIYFIGVTLVGTIDEAIAEGMLYVNDFTGGAKG